jgi:hypothetical protein
VDLARPHAIISRGVDADVLRVLAGTSEEMTGRNVHRLVGHGSNRTVQLALDRLTRQGLALVRELGPSKLYSFNRDHLAAGPVLELMGLPSQLVERLRELLRTWRTPPAYAALFGPAARGDGGPESDVDLFLVRPDDVEADDDRWREQVAALAAAVPRWTGNQAAIAELSVTEAQRLLVDRPRIVEGLRRDAVPLKGPRFDTWTARLG